AEFVAGVEESGRLRIMRATHDVAVEIAAQNFGVAAHDAFGHRVADIRVNLVPVQPEELEPAAVKEKSVERKASLPESDPHRIIVQRTSVHEQRGCDAVEVWRIEVPKFDLVELRQRERRLDGAGFVHAHFTLRARHDTTTIAQFNLDDHGFVDGGGGVQGTGDFD